MRRDTACPGRRAPGDLTGARCRGLRRGRALRAADTAVDSRDRTDRRGSGRDALPGRPQSGGPGRRRGPQRLAGAGLDGAPGGWFHYLCGAATPGHITGPPAGERLSPLEAVYYLTPHWVYALGLSASGLDLVAPVKRAARTQVNARVVTSPVIRGVVNLKTWMWTDARRYEIVLPGRRATVEPTGIRVVTPGVPLVAHDIRRGGCATGGRPDTGDPEGETDCYFTFTKASPNPRDAYQVGFAVRWRVTVAGAARPLTFWATSVQSYTVGEVQVPNGG